VIDADWSVEIGGGAAAIEALWTGFVDLRKESERIAEIGEVAQFSPLARMLLALNGSDSCWWTSKCDLWEESEGASTSLSCYVDLLPFEEKVFAAWTEAEAISRRVASELDGNAAATGSAEAVVRMAVAGEAEGFGITLYLSAEGATREAAGVALAGLMEQAVVVLGSFSPIDGQACPQSRESASGST